MVCHLPESADETRNSPFGGKNAYTNSSMLLCMRFIRWCGKSWSRDRERESVTRTRANVVNGLMKREHLERAEGYIWIHPGYIWKKIIRVHGNKRVTVHFSWEQWGLVGLVNLNTLKLLLGVPVKVIRLILFSSPWIYTLHLYLNGKQDAVHG